MTASLNSVQVVLWSIWTHLLIPLVGAFTISILVGSVAYFLVKIRLRRQLEIQKLKAQIDGLKGELQSILAMTATLTIDLGGPGPFQMPLLTQLNWLVPNEKDGVIGGFRSADGKCIYAGISYRAVAQLINDHGAAPIWNKTLSGSASVDLTKPADAYVLPAFPRFEGHLQRRSNIRILVFSTEDGRKILFPLALETYKQLLVQSKTALTSYQEENWLHKIVPRHRPKSAVLSDG